MAKFRILFRFISLAVLAFLALSLFTMAPATRASSSMEVIASGLNNPRGLGFGPDGTLYVAEAGMGGDEPCISGGEGEACLGLTGSVTRVKNGVQERFITGMPSLAGEGGIAANGPSDVIPHARNLDVVVGLGANPEDRELLGSEGEGLGYLVRAHYTGAFIDWVDVSGYEVANNPDGGLIDSNPYSGAWVDPAKRVIADAGGNDVLVVAANGVTGTLAVFPDRMVEAPPFLGLPPGTLIPMQPVPDAVAVGPDGAIYVGELTGFPFPVGGANVYRVVPGQEPEVFADGFTNIVDIAFDSQGNLYVLEITANGLLSGDFTGALIKVDTGGNRTVVASEGLVAPTSVAVGPDGALYVSNFGVFPGAGQVVRIGDASAATTVGKQLYQSPDLSRVVIQSMTNPPAGKIMEPLASLSPRAYLPSLSR
jgi:sugar lactone lactonase YvrE